MIMSKQTIKDVNVKGKKVIVRVDFNVPMDKETGTKITDENRIIGAQMSLFAPESAEG